MLHDIAACYRTFKLIAIVTTGRTGKLLEAAALFVPVGFSGDWADLALGDRGSAVEMGLQEEQLFLKIGGEISFSCEFFVP